MVPSYLITFFSSFQPREGGAVTPYMEEYTDVRPEHLNIMITCPCGVDLLTPHIHIVQVGLV